MKKNEKGFIAISIIYSIFILFIMILIALMFSYISDRRSSNRIKDDIKNQFSIGTPSIIYSQNGSETKASNFTVRITATKGKFALGTIKYMWSTTQTGTPTTVVENNANVSISLTAGYQPGDYYLISQACDINGNCTTLISKRFFLGS